MEAALSEAMLLLYKESHNSIWFSSLSRQGSSNGMSLNEGFGKTGQYTLQMLESDITKVSACLPYEETFPLAIAGLYQYGQC